MLIIDAGHGGKDPGAIGNGLKEKDLVLEISLYQFKRFKELGILATMTRDSDAGLENEARANRVKSSKAKYCISNHINAGGGTGVETIHSIHDSSILATKIAREIRDTGIPFRKVFSRPGTKNPKLDWYYMHRLTRPVETVIIEYSFIDRKDDIERMNTKQKLEILAESVVKAFCNFINHPYKQPKKEVVTMSNIEKKNEASEWAKEAQEWVIKEGISDGTNPKGLVTREQLWTMLHRIGK